MKIERIRALRGPNLWSKNTSIEALVFCEENERIYDRFASVEMRVRSCLPGLGVRAPRFRARPRAALRAGSRAERGHSLSHRTQSCRP